MTKSSFSDEKPDPLDQDTRFDDKVIDGVHINNFTVEAYPFFLATPVWIDELMRMNQGMYEEMIDAGVSKSTASLYLPPILWSKIDGGI